MTGSLRDRDWSAGAVNHKGRADRKPVYHDRHSQTTQVEIILCGKEKEESCPKYAEKNGSEFKKNAVKLSNTSTKSVAEEARELGISDGMLYRWRQKNTADGEITRYATLEEENKPLRMKTAEQAIEIDMLKKASACFASLHK